MPLLRAGFCIEEGINQLVLLELTAGNFIRKESGETLVLPFESSRVDAKRTTPSAEAAATPPS